MQTDIFDLLGDKPKSLELKSTVQQDEITEKISRIFDYQFEGDVGETLEIPIFPQDFDIGLIVGSSGSGKSTILKTAFGEEERIEWEDGKSIASHFDSFEEASNKFGAVGLNSIPTWLKPYKVLSNGEAFRADLARRLHDNAVIDEFTSVVNREVAISCSVSIEKYIRNNGLKNIVFCSCHDDIIPYLKPAWLGIYKMRHPEYEHMSAEELREKLGYKTVEAGRKFRYVYLRGTKKERKQMYRQIQGKILPYPKRPSKSDKRDDGSMLGLIVPKYEQMTFEEYVG